MPYAILGSEDIIVNKTRHSQVSVLVILDVLFLKNTSLGSLPVACVWEAG